MKTKTMETKKRTYDEDTREQKRIRRLQQGSRPLYKMIRNGTARTKTAWDHGFFGGLEGPDIPSRNGRPPSFMEPCTYYSLRGESLNGYEIRAVHTLWSPLVAVWGFEGVVCVPLQFVEVGHSALKIVPSRPPVCNQCDEITYSHGRCTHCAAPLFYPSCDAE